MHAHDTLRAIQWSEDHLLLLDQRRLPANTVYIDFSHVHDVARAIADMVVRGAPAIGITAAYGVVLAARARFAESALDWKHSIQSDLKLLAASRPTAVNLSWALQRMEILIEKIAADPFFPLLAEAKRIHDEDIAANRRMGELGATLLDGKSVLTHCNAGSLATGGYGTALGVVRSGFADKCIRTVYADETRPWMQGSRLTAWELLQDKIPVTLLCEGASGSLLRQGEVSWVIVGADRVAANGDVANKIGTYGLAINARQHNVNFMVVAPTSTIDMATPCGDDIQIEVRSEREILTLEGQPLAAQGAQAWNPVFDITPAEFVTALVTERGIIHHPNRHKLEQLMQK